MATLVRRLGLWSSIGIVIGITIGGGIFRTPAGIAARVPDPAFMLGRTAGDAGRHRVDELMTPEVVTVSPAQPVVDLVPLFSDRGRHHVPVVDAAGTVVGMLSQSDLIAALYRPGVEQAAPPLRRAA